MFIIKARKYKPLYKKLLKLIENFLNKEKNGKYSLNTIYEH
jgi:hypothetical protein